MYSYMPVQGNCIFTVTNNDGVRNLPCKSIGRKMGRTVDIRRLEHFSSSTYCVHLTHLKMFLIR